MLLKLFYNASQHYYPDTEPRQNSMLKKKHNPKLKPDIPHEHSAKNVQQNISKLIK